VYAVVHERVTRVRDNRVVNKGMNMMLGLKSIGLLSCAMLCAITVSSANAETYDYTGHGFTSVSSPYTASDFVAGSMSFTSPLADNLSNIQVAPDSFSFSDGFQTVTLGTSSNFSFFVSTDASGHITGWNIEVFANACAIADNCIIETNTNSPNAQDIGEIAFPDGSIGSGSVTNDPGTWIPVTPTPLPAALPLFAAGLGALGLLGWRRKRTARTVGV
jgi:hypothetical protein